MADELPPCLERHGERGVGEVVLDRLERPDGDPELLALLRVLHRHVDHPVPQPDERRGGTQGGTVERMSHSDRSVGPADEDRRVRRLPHHARQRTSPVDRHHRL